MSYSTSCFLMEGTFKTKKNNYANLLRHLYGDKLAVLVSGAFIMATLGNIVVTFMTFLEILPTLLMNFGVSETLVVG